MLKKEYSYTTTPPLGLRSLLQGEIYLYLLPLPLCRIMIFFRKQFQIWSKLEINRYFS